MEHEHTTGVLQSHLQQAGIHTDLIHVQTQLSMDLAIGCGEVSATQICRH